MTLVSEIVSCLHVGLGENNYIKKMAGTEIKQRTIKARNSKNYEKVHDEILFLNMSCRILAKH